MTTGNIDGFLHVHLLSMVNCLKTGDPTVDMLLAMVLPYLASQFSKDLIKWIKGLFLRRTKATEPMHVRTISHRTQQTSNGELLKMDNDNYNLVLIKAIQLYVYKNCKLEFMEAEMDLTRVVNNEKETATTSSSKWLKSCSFVDRPLAGTYYDVGIYNNNAVFMKFQDSSKGRNDTNSEDNKGSSDSDKSAGRVDIVRNVEIKLQSHSKEAIHAFVSTAYEWYTNQVSEVENADRFYFDLQRFENKLPSYKRFLLGNGKTFDSLFSKQCHDLKKTVDQFQAKKGRYAIPGYPHKLGLLLSGPPGTGKTSLIKALAHYTNRHIVNVPLNRIMYNSNLMDLLFNQKYRLDDTGAYSKLDFSKLIFVLEDVDAGSNVVKDRALIQAEQTAQMLHDSPHRTSVSSAMRKPRMSRKTSLANDSLNLTGLLNALDGVVESPGRIVIMTTNHPEMLDPALTRPGRIDKHLVLGYMLAEDMAGMINHYYGTKLSPEQEDSLAEMVEEGFEMTAAQLECLTMEADDVDGLLDLLMARHRAQENTIWTKQAKNAMNRRNSKDSDAESAMTAETAEISFSSFER